MTDEEKQQVQNLINARTKLLSEKISRQDDDIKSLSATIITLSNTLEAREREIDTLKSQLSESQEQSRKLLALVQSSPQAPQPAAPKPEKPNYLLSLLRQHFGFDSFRPGQEEIIDALLSGRDVFCSMPSGYGKSLCYRLPALLMPGLTLAVTPDDPEDSPADSQSGILTASLTPSKRREVLRKVRNGTCKILRSTLTQLTEPDTLAALKKSEISMAAILTRWETPNIPEDWTAFTSSVAPKRLTTGVFADTTSPAMRQDIMRAADLHSPLKVITGFSRENRTFRVLKTENKPAVLRDIIAGKNGMAGVVYCSTPENAYKIGEALRDIDGLNDRVIIMPMLLYREISRTDIRFTVHYDLPDTLGSFSQHISLAGSDGMMSECYLLASRNNLRNSERPVISFCNSKDPAGFLMSYVGEEAPKNDPETEAQAVKISPDDVSDFDFGNANESQREAITSASGPLLIIAGPGTGKTFTLVQRAVFLIQKKHVKPENIMLATFTDKAASELTARITQELSRRSIPADTGAMYSGTFHAICARILREYSGITGRSKSFRILDDFGHAYAIMQNIKRFSNIPGLNPALRTSGQGKWANSCELRDCINSLTEELVDPEELARDSSPSVSAMGQAMRIHDDILREADSLSYSALLAETYRLLRDNPEILADLQSRVKYIMVDEYQDTNYLQEQLAFMIAGEAGNICAAGDDDQSIYRFRGAEVRNILEFPERFGKNSCKVVRLILNYRSRPGIISFFSSWMTGTGKFFAWENFRHDKKLEAYRPAMKNNPSVLRLAGIGDKSEWHEKILHTITSLKESGKLTDYNQIAFIFRSVRSADAKALSQFLEEHSISVYSPRSNMYFQRGEVKFAVGCMAAMFPAYFKALETGGFNYNGFEPGYIAYYRSCVQYVRRYIDRPQYSALKKHIATRRKFHENLTGYTGYTFSDLVYELFAYPPFKPALDADISGPAKDLRPARNLSRFVEAMRHYEHTYNINNLHSKYMAGQFQMMMNIYLRFMIEEGRDEYEGGNDAVPSGHVAFMTVHQAKGLEFPVVFADSLWSYPQDNLNNNLNNVLMRGILRDYCRRPEFEPQDRVKYFDFWRLFYVAFSRAQDFLILTCCEDTKTPSRYFEDMYNQLEDADEAMTLNDADITPPKGSGIANTYSFTGDILTYEACPHQYKFFRELEFTPGRSANTFTGTLIHAVLEDIHRAVIQHEENRITPENIAEWFSSEYDNLSRREQAYLSQKARETALGQVMRYVKRQGNDWSAIRRAEYEVSTVRGEYILEGKIDLISFRDGETEITDFKSGAKPNINLNSDRERLESSRRQVFAYAYMLERASGLRVSRMKLYYTGEESSSPEIIYQYDADEAEEIMKGFDGTVRKIAACDFAGKAHDPETCRECSFRHYCGRE